jgi:hypothetical protein
VAKLIIKLINVVAEKINGDPDMDSLLKIVFIPNYNVSLAGTLRALGGLSFSFGFCSGFVFVFVLCCCICCRYVVEVVLLLLLLYFLSAHA